MNKSKVLNIVGSLSLLALANSAFALPALQLGPGGSGTWTYDSSTQTWVVAEGSFSLNAYANCKGLESCNGKYAWDAEGSSMQYAYLVAAAVPETSDNTDAFDITVNGNNVNLITSGFGAPPVQDSNSLGGHGIYDTYFEIYEFRFDGPLGVIYDTQPGTSGSGDGYTESFDISINSLLDNVSGVHFDLFTVSGKRYDPYSKTLLQDLVYKFAPFSHDAETGGYDVPEPSTVLMLGLGLLGFGIRKKASR